MKTTSQVGTLVTTSIGSEVITDFSPKSIGERISYIRSGLTQAEAADLYDVHKNTYARWERNEREPSASDLAKFIDIGGWNANWVLTGEGPERLEAMIGAVSEPSQALRMDRGILKRSTAILAMALDMAQMQVGSTQYSEMLADVYEQLSIKDYEDEDLVVISRALRQKLAQIQEDRDGRKGSENRGALSAHAAELKGK